MSKRTELMNQATHLFSKKGFHQTSVQEIAQATGISKGAFYKHFQSKENILITILNQYYEKILEHATSKNTSTNLSKKEMMKQNLEAELEEWFANREFFTVLFRDFPPNENEDITAIMKKLNTSLMENHRKRLLDAYGSAINPFIFDLVVILRGMLKEYIIFVIFQQKNISIPKLADFIVSSIDAIVESLDEMEPVLVEETVHLEKINVEAELKKRLEQVQKDIESSSVLTVDKQKLLDAVHALQEELIKEKPKSFLIEALFTYLKTEKSLEEQVIILENIFINHSGKL
ncbi:TetR/AcrR family transcriptional regulator [Oceanobacillus halotolerans]|uniref:TetR/AcrR family transcriptional regulator n=1 Tax=Oceanobacillus halotolerans TaxID=2663380 RepID=UPI0013DC40BB|nr:TetR/AcrR family transcriptional regulator [Oceanobacillus halotolerans]